MKIYKISNDRCKYCGGLISWDKYPNQKWPIHVDVNGFKIGMGACPKFNKGFQTNNPKKLSKVPISHSIKSKKSINLKPYLGHIIATFSVICIVVSLSLLGVMFSALNTNNYHYPHNPYDIPNDPDN